MKRSLAVKLMISVVLIFITLDGQLLSQMPGRNLAPATVTGWVDDTHFLLQTLDADKKPVLKSIDVRTGKGVVVQPVKSGRELLAASLPAGVTIGMGDVVSPDEKSVIIIEENDLYFFRSGSKGLVRLTNNDDPEVNARFSPDGQKIAYTRNKDLYVYDLANNREIRLTFDASDRVYNGYASWVYMEEILGRASRYAAFWWSPDGNRIAYLRTDESDVPLFTLNRLDEADGIHGLLEQVPYPKAGDPNPKVKMGIAEVATAKTVWVKTDYSVDQYIAWPFWTPDSKKLAVQVLNRDQNHLKIILSDPATGDFTQIYEELRRTWVEFYETIYVLNNGSGFIVKSYRNDWENLYYHGWDGRLISQLTGFDFRVTAIERVDEELQVVYFNATGPESTDSHFFRVGLDGKNLMQLTSGPGTHNVSVSPKGNYYIDTWNSITSAGSIVSFNKNLKVLREIHRFEQIGRASWRERV